MDVALFLERSGDTLPDILERNDVTPDNILAFNQDPIFLRKVGDLRADISKNGLTFRLKARAQAEELLLTSYSLIHSADVGAAVKADLIKATVRWGGLEIKPESGAGDGSGGGVTIQINLPGQTQKTLEPVVIEHAE